MTTPGDRRPAAGPARPRGTRDPGVLERVRPRSVAQALIEALLVAGLAAITWALLKGVLEFPGVLAVAVVGGWAIGALLWQVRLHPLAAASMALLAWVLGLVLTWVVAMAILPSSVRTFFERLEGTPFLEWLSPQFGWLELAGLVLYVGAALYGARPRSA